MKRISFLTITLLLVFLGVSCTPKDDSVPDEPTLKLSTNSLVFTKEAQNPTAPQVKITTNQSSWFATTSADWLELQQNGDGLLIKASENTKGLERKANVYVQVSGKQSLLQVTQSSADIIIGFAPNEAIFPQIGGEKIVLVKSNIDSWTLDEMDDDLKSWLTVTANEEKGILLLTATENTTTSDREGRIFAKSSQGVTTELIVRQKGFAQYYLPWFEKDLNVYNLIKFERQRGNIFTDQIEPSEDHFGTKPGYISFISNNEKFPTFTYIYSLYSSLVYDGCYILCTDVDELKEDGGYIQWLLTQGYSKRDNSTTEEPRYENEDHSMFVNIKWIRDKATDDIIGAQVIFAPQVVQDKPMPSFSQLPVGPANYLDNLRNKNVKVSEVEAFEAKHNGTIVENGKILNPKPEEGYEKEAFYMVYNVAESNKDYAANVRLYQFYIHFDDPNFLKPANEDLYQTIAYGYLGFKDLDRGLFFVGKGQFKITLELQTLLKENGYKFVKIGTGADAGFIYYNPESKIVLTIQLWSDPLVNGGEQTLVLRYHKEEMSIPSSMTLDSKSFNEMKSGNISAATLYKMYQPSVARMTRR